MSVEVELSDITFDNDFYTLSLEDGSILVLNKIDESILYSNTITDINSINIVHAYYDDDEELHQDVCTNIIGMSDSLISIKTDYTEYLGKPLNSDNMKYCTIEV